VKQWYSHAGLLVTPSVMMRWWWPACGLATPTSHTTFFCWWTHPPICASSNAQLPCTISNILSYYSGILTLAFLASWPFDKPLTFSVLYNTYMWTCYETMNLF
jgi:hypothetical protein